MKPGARGLHDLRLERSATSAHLEEECLGRVQDSIVVRVAAVVK